VSQRLQTFLTGSSELRQITDQARRLRAIQAVYARNVPASLAQAARVTHLAEATLTLTAANSAAAAKLRQMIPDLVRSLQSAGHPIHSIRIRVDVTHAARTATPKRKHGGISPKAQAELENLAEKLQDSPLADALKRMADRCGKK
jgi:hypothetical protein